MAKNGGSAFPAEYYSPETFMELRATEGVFKAKEMATGVSQGMSLRDWFAANAPNVSDERVREEVHGFPVFDNSGYHNGYPHETIREQQRKAQVEWMISARIKWRWQYADAMLAQRENDNA